MPKPLFNTARGTATLTTMPPFDFDGVVSRIFPLRASMYRLQHFCDSYLNHELPPEVGVFRPAVPYVFFMMINYGRMTSEVVDVGWVAQNEMLFNIPLEWHRLENGKLVFHDWASLAPFIYVDATSSKATGREVYGWPKQLATLTPELNPWGKHPRNPRNLLTCSANSLEEFDADGLPELRTLFEIWHAPSPSVTQMPPDPRNPISPLMAWPQAVANSMDLFGEYMDMFWRSPLRGYPPYGDNDLTGQAAKLVETLSQMGESAGLNSLNLKQFRGCSDPAEACYQSLNNSRMTVKRFIGGGLLADTDLLRGDPSAGFHLKLHRSPSHPIIETLGLEVEEEANGVATLRPEFPMWNEVDMNYGVGETLAWRSGRGRWHVLDPEDVGEEGLEEGTPEVKTRFRAPGDSFNMARGAAEEEIGGALDFSDITVRVLPLLADHGRLQTFVDSYLNSDDVRGGGSEKNEEGYRFEAWGSYVYLIVNSYGEMTTSNGGYWANRGVWFTIPLKWYWVELDDEGNEKRTLVSTGFTAPYMFSDSDIAATTAREVNGWPTMMADLTSPPSAWMGCAGPAADYRGHLQLDADVFTSLGTGQELQRRCVMEVSEGDIIGQFDYRERMLADTDWAPKLIESMEEMVRESKLPESPVTDLKALALEVFACGKPLNHVSLKQFRDSEEPESACYQAIVNQETIIEQVKDCREIDQLLHVAIHQYPTLPIVETLGLAVKKRELRDGIPVDILQPIRPFWLRGHVRTGASQEICWRAGTPEWRVRPPAGSAGGDDEKAPPLSFYFPVDLPPDCQDASCVGRELVDLIDNPQNPWPGGATKPGPNLHFTKLVAAAWAENPATSDRRLRFEDGRNAVGNVQPQAAIQSILSHEWEHWGNPRWYQRAQHKKGSRTTPPESIQEKPDVCVRADSVGSVGAALFKAKGFEIWPDLTVTPAEPVFREQKPPRKKRSSTSRSARPAAMVARKVSSRGKTSKRKTPAKDNDQS